MCVCPACEAFPLPPPPPSRLPFAVSFGSCVPVFEHFHTQAGARHPEAFGGCTSGKQNQQGSGQWYQVMRCVLSLLLSGGSLTSGFGTKAFFFLPRRVCFCLWSRSCVCRCAAAIPSFTPPRCHLSHTHPSIHVRIFFFSFPFSLSRALCTGLCW